MGKGKSDLILNGDTFELWQSLEPNDCVQRSNKNLSCAEAEALKRLARVLQAHQLELTSIKSFAAAGDNRVVIIPGNHDVALLFENVAKEVLRAIGAPEDRVRIASTGHWLSPDHLIYAEHGHQIGKEGNRFNNWPKPFTTVDGTQ